MPTSTVTTVTLLVAFSCLVPRWAAANGAYSHIHVSQLAVGYLPAGELRDLLADPQVAPALEAGSMFPDSGYVFHDAYGEEVHWPRFQNAYLGFLRERYAGDFTTLTAQREAAFLLGDMSHGLADQVYDYTLLDRALEVDGDGPVSADELADYFLVVDRGVLLETEAWGPYDDLSRVLTERVGTPTTPETLADGMAGMESVIFVQALLGPGRYLEAWNAYPFLGTHIYNPDAPGSLPHLGEVVAAHLQAAWRRLRGEASMDTDLVTFTMPPDGGQNFPVDASEVGDAYRRIGLVFSYGVRRSQVAPLLSLRDPDGAPVAFGLRTPYGGELRNFLMLVPDAALAHDTEYTVEVAPGVENLDGERSTVPYAFSFRTRCPPERLDDCPPLPAPLVTGPIPTELPSPEDVVEPGPDAGGFEPDAGTPAPDKADPPPELSRAGEETASSPDTAGDDAAPPPGRLEGGGGCASSPSAGGTDRAAPAPLAMAPLLLFFLALARSGGKTRRRFRVRACAGVSRGGHIAFPRSRG